MNLNLKGKIAIVTGGGSGLGAAISELFAEEGSNVVVNYIAEQQSVIKFVERLNQKYNTNSISLYGDITSAKDIDETIDQALKRYGGLDILINNAGIWPKSYVKDMSDEEWSNTINVNLTGQFLFSKRVVKYFIEQHKEGKIINIVSPAAFYGSYSGHAHYAASKGGMVAFTVSLAREVARYGINVTAVAPGMMKTEMTHNTLIENEKEYLKRIPLGRIATPREIAYTVVFLASDKANYITGATIDVTGGMLMR